MSKDIWKATLKQEIKDGKVYYCLIKKNLVTGEEISTDIKGDNKDGS